MVHPSNLGLARLRQDLLRRRWGRLEPRLRFQLAVLALGLAVFVFWKLRVIFGDLGFSHGTRGAGAALLATLACLLVVGGAGTALRLHPRLRGAPDGPAWLSLPVPASELLRHQAWEAEMPWRATFLFAAAACIAAVRIAPGWVVLGGAIAFPFGWAVCCRAGVSAARAFATPAGVTARSPSPSRITSREGSWRRRSLSAALVHKDLWLARRSREARLAMLPALVLGMLSVAVWSVPALRAGAFAVALLATAAFGEWLIVLGSRDPFAVLRSLPIEPGALWRSRMLWGGMATLLLVLAHALAAQDSSTLLAISLAWLGVSGVAIAALAINLQLTLFPQHAPALRLLGLALALALVCSVMIPLLGWGVLLGSVFHTARRLKHWWTLEDAA